MEILGFINSIMDNIFDLIEYFIKFIAFTFNAYTYFTSILFGPFKQVFNILQIVLVGKLLLAVREMFNKK